MPCHGVLLSPDSCSCGDEKFLDDSAGVEGRSGRSTMALVLGGHGKAGCCRSVGKIMSIVAGVQRLKRPKCKIANRDSIPNVICDGISISLSSFSLEGDELFSQKGTTVVRFMN